ncbi:MAG: hypothetical protein ABIH89_01550, partial [Elusimicrobiota bacterium]
MKLSGYCFGTGFMIILLGFISCRLNAFSAASLLGRSVFFLTRVTIFLLSVTAILFVLLVRRNLWWDAGMNLFLGPVEMLLASCLVLKIYDPNFPILNRVMRSMIFPFISSVIAACGSLFFAAAVKNRMENEYI